MVLSILILCIVSMTSLSPVASSNSSSLPSDLIEISDFGFSRLIDNLVSANNDSSSREAMLIIFAEIENQSKYLSEYYKSNVRFLVHEIKNTSEREQYELSIADIVDSYVSVEVGLKEEIFYDPIEDFRNLVREDTSKLGAALQQLRHTNIVTGKNVMDLSIESINPRKEADECSQTKQSLQYAIYAMYRDLVITTVQGYAVSIYTYNLLREDDHGYIAKKKLARMEYRTAIRDFQKSAASAMNEASREICSSDRRIKRKGKKYIKLEWLFNTIVVNERYLNEQASCWESCDYYENTTFHQYVPQPLDELNICHGRIYNCFQRRVESYCPTVENSRRFDGLLPKMGRTACSEKHDISNKFDNGGTFAPCDQCICYCDDYKRNDTIRRFSLRAVKSDTSKNRVITGIQFVEINRTIYLRIQDGELRPNGMIEKSTLEWQPVDEIDWKSPFITEYDYVTITYDTKIVNFDTLIASSGRVLTGIQLHTQGTHLALKIKSQDYDQSIGILRNKTSFWQSHSPMTRQEITMTAPDNPDYMKQPVIDKRKNTYVKFRMTDLEKDAGQTAIPFIDAQPVVSDPPVPLSGAGIYYSGQTEYGGSIGLKVVTYDATRLLRN